MEVKILASSSAGNCAIVSGAMTSVMLDCGILIRRIRQAGVNLPGIDGCLVSHEHADHAYAALELLRAGVDIYASEYTLAAMGICEHHRAHSVAAGQEFKLGTWTVLPFATFHDSEEPLGYLIADCNGNKLLYAPDTGRLPYIFPGLTHILIECNHDPILLANADPVVAKRIAINHMSIEAVCEFLSRQELSKLKEVWLLHLSDGNSDEEEFKRKVQEATGVTTKVAKKSRG